VGIAEYVVADQVKGPARFENDAVWFNRAGTDFRALGVEHRGYRSAKSVCRCAEHREPSRVSSVRLVGEIEPRDVHASFDHVGQRFLVGASWSERRHNLGLAKALPRSHGADSISGRVKCGW